MHPVKTLTQFRATRQECADIGERFGIDFGDQTPRAGYVYDGDCYIERQPDGSLYLLIGRADWQWRAGHDLNGDEALSHLEAILYVWAIGELGGEFGMPDDVIRFFDELAYAMPIDDLATAIERNAAEPNPDVCHTHDFCDANMAAAAALEITSVTDEAIDRINALWTAARPWLRDEQGAN